MAGDDIVNSLTSTILSTTWEVRGNGPQCVFLSRSVVISFLAFMFRTPILRLFHTSRQFINVIPETIKNPSSPPLTPSDMARPSGLIANKGLELLTFGTPNGHKASIILEELKEAYGKPDYVFQSIPIMENIQKEKWFTDLGPNGRIPVLVDHDNGQLPIMEGASILSYLTRNYDPEHKFSFAQDPELSECEQWVAWQHGGLGPMQGQANHFYRLAKERLPYPTQRYVGETERLYGVLDARLARRDYLVGPGPGTYSIADIASFAWVNVASFAGVQLPAFPHLQRWWGRVHARPAVQRGTAVPSESQLVNRRYTQRLQEEPEFRRKEEELAEICRRAKELYGYQYASP